MADLVVDIETVALPLEPDVAECLTRNCKDDAEKAEELGKAALWPVTARLACIGILNPASDQGTCFYDNNETTVLREFWKIAPKYQRIVTFNGRAFDIPFIIARSAMLGVIPSRRDLVGNRFSAFPHCDLLDQFTFYGATRKFPMHVYCRAFGIDSPKKDGMDGSKIGELYAAGEMGKIVAYNTDDLKGTAALFKVWQKFYEQGNKK